MASITDDPGLLDLFIADMERQSDLWKPTAYWKGQCRRIQRQLERTGLDGFRTNRDLMRGVDLGPKQAGLRRQPVFRGGVGAWLSRYTRFGRQYETCIDDLVSRANAVAQRHIGVQLSLLYHLLGHGRWSAPVLAKVDDSGAGKPDVHEFGGRRYSSNMLHHICLVSMLFAIGQTDGYRRIIEIGGGYGALPELLVKYRDGAIDYFVEVDIPPLVYVSTQYLKAVFPGKVLDYRDVRSAQHIRPSDIQGRILVIPPWSVPTLDLEFDLFWNSASFQEMSEEVIENYLGYVCSKADRLFVNTLAGGHPSGPGSQTAPIRYEYLARQIRIRGYLEQQLASPCVEGAAYRSVLPRHTAALFTRASAQSTAS